jgi:hypothetical protein
MAVETRNASKLALVFVLTLPMTGWSCEPIIPLYQLLSGSSFVGPLLAIHSLGWLAAAALIKSVAFVFL